MDSTLTIWIARADGRMSSIDATGRIDYTESDLATIPNYHCQEVAFDKEDHTWVLAEDIARVFQDSVENISITFPDEGSPLTDVQTDTNDVVWVSRYLNSDENHHSCIAYKNGPIWTYVDSNAASPPGGFFSIAVDKFNNKWFGGTAYLRSTTISNGWSLTAAIVRSLNLTNSITCCPIKMATYGIPGITK